jgi:hypothetical protein
MLLLWVGSQIVEFGRAASPENKLQVAMKYGSSKSIETLIAETDHGKNDNVFRGGLKQTSALKF